MAKSDKQDPKQAAKIATDPKQAPFYPAPTGAPQPAQPELKSLAELFASGVDPLRCTLSAAGYDQLAQVLADAFYQASAGKGAERHANEKPFHEQPMQRIAERRGIGFILGQADKKSEEAHGMLDRGQAGAAEHELLGAIVYLAGAVIHIRNSKS